MKRVVIVNSRHIFGGTIVLSLLCKLLREKGIDARIFYVHDFPSSNTNMFKFWIRWTIYSFKYHLKRYLYQILRKTRKMDGVSFQEFEYYPIEHSSLKEQCFPFFNKKKTIVVYPEVVYGNFLRANNVVRWLLYYYKWKDLQSYDSSDLFICYRQLFNDWELNPQGYEIKLVSFDSNLYRQYNFKDRAGNCYVLRKGANRKDLPSSFDGPVIDYGMKEAEIVEIFNTHKFCYLYDTQTFYAKIAAVCGCIPIVVLEPGKSKEDYLKGEEISMLGVAYGDSSEEIKKAIDTREALIKSLDYSDSNDINILKFIDLLNVRFNLCS